MKKSILVTGVSGAGKSTLSKKLRDMGYAAYDMDSHPGLFAMIDKKTGKPVEDHDNDDLAKVQGMDWICDKEKLKAIINTETNSVAFYCGTASNIDDILPLFDQVLMLTVNADTMRHRLTSRTENDFGRTSEVQDWILTWKEWWENEMKEKGAMVLDAHANVEEVARLVVQKTIEDGPS